MKAEIAARPGVVLFLALVLGIALATGLREAAAGAGLLLLAIPHRWAWIAVGFVAGATLGKAPDLAPGRVWLDGDGTAVSVAMPEMFGGGWRSEITGPDGRRWMVKNGSEAALGETVRVRGVGRARSTVRTSPPSAERPGGPKSPATPGGRTASR